MTNPGGKIAWSGVVTSVQPRIRLTRSFDQRSHTYQGYVLRVRGTVGDEAREVSVAIGEAAQAKHGFQTGDTVPALPVYRERGHRRLAARTYDTSCRSCIWGALMAVEMIVDHWNASQKRYRTETFCYGPLSCPLYRAGPTRKVPGRKGMSWEEEDWVDEDAVSHRDPDD